MEPVTSRKKTGTVNFLILSDLHFGPCFLCFVSLVHNVVFLEDGFSTCAARTASN
jgi:hypothetical protein